MPGLKLYLFGSPRLERAGESIHIARRKASALLAYLSVTSRHHSREALAAIFWPDYDHRQGRADLSRTLSVLNKLLDPGILDADREMVVLKPGADLWVDVRHFRKLQADADAHDHSDGGLCAECLPLLTEAVSLYQADFLAGFTLANCPEFDGWQLQETEALRQELSLTLTRLARWHGELGDWTSAIDYARRWVEVEPLREQAHALLMSLYAQSGQWTIALAQFEKLRQVLEDELGVEPGPEIESLHENIRQGEGDLPWSSDRLSVLDPRPPAFLVGGADISGPRPVIVARENELQRLDEHFQVALEGRGGVVFVTGEAGEGKSALLGEFARRIGRKHRDTLVGVGNCHAYTGFGDPYLPFRDVLSMLTGDAEAGWAAGTLTRSQALRLWSLLPKALDVLLEAGPDLIEIFVSSRDLIRRASARGGIASARMEQLDNLLSRTREGTASLEQSRLFEQYTLVLRTLADRWPLLILLDDLQWSDAASINLLFQLGRSLAGSRILILGAYRPSELEVGRPARAADRRSGGHPLKSVVHELKRHHGDVQISVGRMTTEAGRAFVDAWLDKEPNHLGQAFRELLFNRTKGHPLFTVELLRDMQERGDLIQDQDGQWMEGPELIWDILPARVEAVIEQRLGRLDPALQEILAVGSIEGETFTAQIVSEVLGIKELVLLRQLSQELELRHRLVRERGEAVVGEQRLSQFQFSHVLFQQYLYEGLGQAERRLLHGRIAGLLERKYAGQVDLVAARLARHYVEAGEHQQAINALLRAGDQARGLYAYQAAIDHYQEAIAYLKRDENHERTARTLMKLGLSYHMNHEFQQAGQIYEEGFILWQQLSERMPEDLTDRSPHPLRGHWSAPVTLDPALAGQIESVSLIDQLFSSLVEHSPEMDVVPAIAQNWEVLENGRVYLFHLRRDVRWSDGTPVTAEDFEYSWKRVLDPTMNSPAAPILYDIQGARAFHQGRTSDPSQVGVQALDKATLKVELEGPTGYFPHLLAFFVTYPVPRHAVEAHDSAWTYPDRIVTNGPFQLLVWEPGDRMVLIRNPDYHGQFKGNVDRVELSFDSDPSVPLRLYDTDEVDFLSHFTLRKIPTEQQGWIRRRHANDLISAPGLYTNFLGFDTSRPPFDDSRVRQAIVLATNRASLVTARRSHETPATGGFVPPGMPGHSPDIGLPYDPEGARNHLSSAGYPAGKGFPPVDAFAPRSYAAFCESLEGQWRQSLGIEISWQPLESSKYVSKLAEAPPHLYLHGWMADYPDPVNFLHESKPIQRGRWHNETFTNLVDAARGELGQERRMDLYRKADKILVEDAAIAPLTYGHKHMLVKPWVKRYPISALKFWFWKDVVIEAQKRPAA